MKPTITLKVSPHSLLSDSISSYVDKRVGTLSKFLYEENSVRVEIRIDSKQRTGLRYNVDMYVLPGGAIFAKADGEDVFEAVDLCIPKLKEQLAKKKDKKVALRREIGSKRKESTEFTELS